MTEFVENKTKEKYFQGENWRQILAALSVCYICLSGGNILGYTSAAIPSIREETSFSENETTLLSLDNNININNSFSSNDSQQYVYFNEFSNLTDTQASWISGLSPLGAIFGSFIALIPIKTLGPKSSLLYIGCPLYAISWFLTAFAPSISIIYLGRFIGGLSMGLTTSIVPVYIVSIASISLRGPLGVFSQAFITLGILINFILGCFLNWRFTALTCGVLLIPNFFLLAFTPESFVWLLSKNRNKEAEESFRKLRGSSALSQEEFQFLENNAFLDMNQNTNRDKSETKRVTWPNIKSSLVTVGIMSFQQLVGISGINFYTVSLFRASGSVMSGHLSSTIVAAVNFLVTCTSYYLIEKVGRKILLTISIITMSIQSFILGTFFYLLKNEVNLENFMWVPLTSLVLFVLAFSSGYGPVTWIICAEITSSEIREIINPIGVAVNWFAVFLVSKTYPDLVNCLDAYGTFWIYGTIGVVGTIFTILCVPETKQKTAEEIQRFFGHGHKKVCHKKRINHYIVNDENFQD